MPDDSEAMGRTPLQGAVRGLVATTPMSTVFLAQRGGRVPPEEIFRRVVRATGKDRLGALWPLAHVAIGVSFGALAEAIGVPPQRRFRTAFGTALFLVDYGLLAPRLRLYPRLGDDPRRRRRVNLISHAVFGFALGHSG